MNSVAMHPSNLLILILTLLITFSCSKLANPAMNKSFLANAEHGTIWRNNPSLLHNEFPDDFSMRIILPHDIATSSDVYSYLDTSFACGFFCAGVAATCDAYIFSVFVVSGDEPQVVWSANRDRPVRENATVELTELGDLVLYDADGTLVWSTNTADKSVVSMNLTSLPGQAIWCF